MENRKAYLDKMAARLKEWDDEIVKLEEKVFAVKTDARAEYHKQLMELLNKKDAAESKLKNIIDARDDVWQELKSGIELSWEILEDSIKNARAKIK